MTSMGRKYRGAVVLASLAVILLASAATAAASPGWRLQSLSNTTVADGETLTYLLHIRNAGDSPADLAQNPLKLEVSLPDGLTAVSATSLNSWDCSSLVPGASTFSCVRASDIIEPVDGGSIAITVQVGPGATGTLLASFEVTGGGAPEPGRLVDPVTVTSTVPPFGIDAFDVAIAADGAGTPYVQAGGHPDQLTVDLDFNTATDPAPLRGLGWPREPARDVVTDLPPGLVGDPTALARCTLGELSNGEQLSVFSLCDPNSQVGMVSIRTNVINNASVIGPLPIFNMPPPPGSAARFGFNFAGTIVVLDARLRYSGDYGLSVDARNISEGIALAGSSVTFWGAPGAAKHDLERSCPGKSATWEPSGGSCPGSGDQTPFFRLPTHCSGQGLPFTMHADSWFNPASFDGNGEPVASDPRWKSRAVTTHLPPSFPHLPSEWGEERPLVGCEQVPVTGNLSARPTARDAKTSSGLQVHLEVPNPGLENPDGIASSDLKEVKVTLPEGMTINPSQAEGLGVCSPDRYESSELSFHPDGSKGCPSDSKIGTVEVKTPLLEETIPGNVYVAKPYDNPFGSLLALYVVLEEPQRGILVKLAGEVKTDHTTGQITAEFEDLPQLPFSTLDFRFREGSRAPLVTPQACGVYETKAEITGWSDPAQPITSTSSFEIDRGIGGSACPGGGLPGFKPGLIAGSRNNAAGAYSPFDLRLFRTDAEQEFTHFSVKLPPGLIGKLAGVPFCPEAAMAAAKDPSRTGAEELASPSCPAASEIGRTLVGAGVGSVLAYAPGKVYLAGPYNGSALSIAAITAAKVGPFDLGTVVVREALKVNPDTAEVFIDPTGSDPLPHIIDGITTHLRDIRVYVERPQFTLNPTDCTPTSVASTVLGSGLDFASPGDDVPVTVTTRYQAADCAALGFKPRLSLRLLGATKRSGNPALRAVLRPRPGDANIGRAQVTLPPSEFLAQENIGTICTRVQFNQGEVPGEACPQRSVYGYARATTPLLDEPIEGPVFLRSSSHPLPDLVAALHAGRIDINVVGRIDQYKRGIRTTFESVPDAPVTKFTLTMKGGDKSLLANSTNLCRRPHRALAKFTGQNGKRKTLRPLMRVACGKGGKRKR